MLSDYFCNWTPGKPFVPMQCRFMSNQSGAASVLCKPHMHTAALAISVNLEKSVTIGVDDRTVNLPPVSLTPLINLPPVRWCTWSWKYLREVLYILEEITRGPGKDDTGKKTYLKSKSSDTAPLIQIFFFFRTKTSSKKLSFFVLFITTSNFCIGPIHFNMYTTEKAFRVVNLQC